MALALKNLKRVDMPFNKETKPNYYYYYYTELIWEHVFSQGTLVINWFIN